MIANFRLQLLGLMQLSSGLLWLPTWLGSLCWWCFSENNYLQFNITNSPIMIIKINWVHNNHYNILIWFLYYMFSLVGWACWISHTSENFNMWNNVDMDVLDYEISVGMSHPTNLHKFKFSRTSMIKTTETPS